MRQIFFHCLVAEKYIHILFDKTSQYWWPAQILTSFNPSWVSPPSSFPSLFPDLISTCQWKWYVLPSNSENISFRFSSLKSLTCFWLTQSAPLPHPPSSSLSYFCFLYSPLPQFVWSHLAPGRGQFQFEVLLWIYYYPSLLEDSMRLACVDEF